VPQGDEHRARAPPAPAYAGIEEGLGVLAIMKTEQNVPEIECVELTVFGEGNHGFRKDREKRSPRGEKEEEPRRQEQAAPKIRKRGEHCFRNAPDERDQGAGSATE